MPFDKKRQKQIQQLTPAIRHLVKRSFTIERKDISDALEKKKEIQNDNISSDEYNYSLDNDDYSSEEKNEINNTNVEWSETEEDEY